MEKGKQSSFKLYGKTIGLLAYFIIAQCIATVGLIFWKVNTDEYWLDNVLSKLGPNGELTLAYFTAISDLIFIALIIADILIILPMLGRSVIRKEKILGKIDRKEALMIFCSAICLNVIVSVIIDVLPASSSTSNYGEMMGMVTSGKFGLVLLSSGILAPVVEELIFRYGIFSIFSKKSETYKIILSSTLFGIAHMNLIQSTYAFLFGVVLGKLYKDRNLAKPLLFHLVVNTSSVLYEFLPGMRLVWGIVIVGCFAYCGWGCVAAKGKWRGRVGEMEKEVEGV